MFISNKKNENIKKGRRMEDKNKIFKLLLAIFSIGFFGSAILSYFTIQFIIKSQIIKNVVLTNNSKSFEFWKDPPAEILRKYYFFSITNPYEIEKGEKPILKEHGPYTYREKWEKRNIEFIGSDQVRFNPVVTLIFEPSLSVGNENDQLTILNIPAIGMIENSLKGNADKSSINFVNSIMYTKLFIKRTVKQLLSGYEDDLLDMAKDMMPDKIKSNIFSITKGKNGTIKNQFSIRTGSSNCKNKGSVVTFNGKNKLDIWDNNDANTIKGTDGTMFPPFLSENHKLWFFNPEICRSIYFEYKEDTHLYDMDLKTYHFPKNIFYNSSLNPLNKGFCSDNQCFINGVHNISRCYDGMSVFISQPHFLNAEENLKNEISGILPEDSKHETIINFDQNTAVPITGAIRLQINFYIHNDKDINLIKNIKPNLLPFMWFEESLKLDKPVMEELAFVAKIVKLSKSIPFVLLYLGITVLAISLFFSGYIHFKNKLKYSVLALSPMYSISSYEIDV